jgi:hypothetical protein
MAIKPIRWGLALALGLGLPGAAAADSKPIFSSGKVHGCPAPSYSAFHYWTPSFYRIRGYLNPHPQPSPYPPERHPDVSPSFQILRFPCPAAEPSAQYPRFDQPPAAPTGTTGRPETGVVPGGTPFSGDEPKKSP